jgi:hypothetical protein
MSASVSISLMIAKATLSARGLHIKIGMCGMRICGWLMFAFDQILSERF